MNFANSTTMLWLLRQLLQFGGAYLTFKGYTNEAGADAAIDAVFALIGPLSLIVGFAGNIWASFRNKVTVNGQAVGTGTIQKKVGGAAAAEVVQAAEQAIASKPTLWERITNR